MVEDSRQDCSDLVLRDDERTLELVLPRLSLLGQKEISALI